MKILLCVGCFNGAPGQDEEYDLLYVRTWRHFVEKNRDKLPAYDFLFSNGGFDFNNFREAAGSVKTRVVDDAYPPGDQDMTYAAIRFAEGYDFAVRCDQDAFPQVETLNKIASFLEQHPEIDMLSPAGTKQTITPLHIASNQTTVWQPWGQPPPGDEIVFFKKKLMDEAYKQFDVVQGLVDPDVPVDSLRRPYTLNTLAYKEICDLMKCKPLNAHWNTEIPRIDGQIGTNIFTSMCLLGFKQAEIRDRNRSFECKLKVSEFRPLSTQSWMDTVDAEDKSLQFLPGLDAPFFHLGWSYLTSLHFYPIEHPTISQDLRNSFYQGNFQKGNNFGMWATHAAIIKFLCVAHGTREMNQQFESNLQSVRKLANYDRTAFDTYCEQIEAFYKPAMSDYF